jgi:hypothetical protein
MTICKKKHTYFLQMLFLSKICYNYLANMRGTALRLKSIILDRMDRSPSAVWIADDFADLGSRTAIDTALHRLVAAKDIRRITRGIYDRPGTNLLTGKGSHPDYRKIIDAIARRDGVRILVDGITAANDLGLTDAVPSRPVVLTDARIRPVKVENLLIQFKHVSPNRLYWAGRPAMRVVQALHWVRDMLPSDKDKIFDRLRTILSDAKHGKQIRDDLRAGISTLPAWLQDLVRDLMKHSNSLANQRDEVSVPMEQK